MLCDIKDSPAENALEIQAISCQYSPHGEQFAEHYQRVEKWWLP
jgi:hypothetical protein